MTATPLIHVVDDDEPMRTALVRLIAAAGFEARGYGSAGDFLLHPVPNDRAGCVLLDLSLPGPSGLDLQSALLRQGISLPVIFLTGYGEISSSVRAMKAGAVDFLEKPVEPDILLQALQRALALHEIQRRALSEADRLRERFALLSPREREVFNHLVAGRLNKQIAHTLRISERTVKAVRAAVMTKLDAHSAAELGQLAERLARLPQGDVVK
jgi:FixJ family two-component response regulator